MTAIGLEFLPSETNVDRGVQNLDCELRQMHTALMALTSYEANDIAEESVGGVADCRSDMIRRQEEGNVNSVSSSKGKGSSSPRDGCF